MASNSFHSEGTCIKILTTHGPDKPKYTNDIIYI